VGNAKLVSMSVRPSQVSHLCFETDGILGGLNTQLGASAAAFDFDGFYAALGAFPTVAGDASRSLYDAAAIQSYVKPFALVNLRAEPRKMALAKAMNARQNSYFAKYANAPAIISLMNSYYSPSVTDSKPNRLAELARLSTYQANGLGNAYVSDGRTDVVKTTGSVLQSNSQGHIDTQETGQSNDVGEQFGERVPFSVSPPPPAGGQVIAAVVGVTGTAQRVIEDGTSGSTSSSSTYAGENQTIVNTDYGYRMPYLESQAQNERAQISLIDQQFAQFMAGQNLPNLAQVFQNELNSIDGDIYRLQIGFLNTILMSPFAGTVTGIYKNPGDSVRAGEPVIRVENNQTVHLMAMLVYRGPMVIGSSVSVQTKLFDAAGPAITLTGNVVAAHGQAADDHWSAVIQCNNLDSASQPILPSGYRFDFDNTTVSIT
jgi:biotin carboxyl carrier protein